MSDLALPTCLTPLLSSFDTKNLKIVNLSSFSEFIFLYVWVLQLGIDHIWGHFITNNLQYFYNYIVIYIIFWEIDHFQWPMTQAMFEN